MQYEANTPEEYLGQLKEDWRKDQLEKLRMLLLSHQLIEEIKYEMLSYSDKKGVIFYLNAQKNYVALYVGDASKVDPEGELLQGIDHGKGCLRFKKSTLIKDTYIDDFITKTVDMWKQGEDVGC